MGGTGFRALTTAAIGRVKQRLCIVWVEAEAQAPDVTAGRSRPIGSNREVSSTTSYFYIKLQRSGIRSGLQHLRHCAYKCQSASAGMSMTRAGHSHGHAHSVLKLELSRPVDCVALQSCNLKSPKSAGLGDQTCGSQVTGRGLPQGPPLASPVTPCTRGNATANPHAGYKPAPASYFDPLYPYITEVVHVPLCFTRRFAQRG